MIYKINLFFFGIHKKRFYNFKRIVTNKNIGPIVKTVMTRCIHCTRCVRFSKEIAGIESLGIFGRGMNSEIGTYINKVFNSELSGNIIDICPVGALTSKQYPFLGRVWELKNIKSIDFSDSSLTPIQVFVKSNSVVKITSSYNIDSYSNTWISDKTRFSFDGMFSPERIVKPYLLGSFDKTKQHKKWLKIFEDIIFLIYFKDHLSRHIYRNFNLYIIFSNSLDIESINLLTLLKKKYSFIKLRKLEKKNKTIDLESMFLLNSFKDNINISESEICFLLNTNPRYENSSLNLLIRQRFLKGNFKIITAGSLIDLRYPTVNLGSSSQFIKTFVNGTSNYCQDFINYKNPVILLSSNMLKRSDYSSLLYKIHSLNNITKYFKKLWAGHNVLSTELNETGTNFLNTFKKFSTTDFSNSFCLYFIDLNTSSVELNQLINLKLLNLLNMNYKSKLLIESTNIPMNYLDNSLIKELYSSAYVGLPNNTFFESSNLFLNNLLVYKKTSKIISSANKSKENWQIIRKITSSLLNINFFSFNNLKKNKLIFNIKNFIGFLKFISFNYFPISSISNKTVFYKENINPKILHFSLKYKLKYIISKHIYWLEDFYLGGRDNYSSFSSIMIECSTSFRKEFTNFKYII